MASYFPYASHSQDVPRTSRPASFTGVVTRLQRHQPDEIGSAQRWRQSVLKLSNILLDTTSYRPELTPILAQAFEYATIRLVAHGDEQGLFALERWLEEHFELHLPSGDTKRVREVDAPGGGSTPEGQGEPPISTLLVDDNNLFLQATKRFLSASPAVSIIGTAGSALDAMDKVKQLRPDLVLMDVAMPGVNGLEATARLKTYSDPPRVIILTMEDSPEGRAAAKAVHADGFVTKALMCTELLPLIAMVFGTG